MGISLTELTSIVLSLGHKGENTTALVFTTFFVFCGLVQAIQCGKGWNQASGGL